MIKGYGTIKNMSTHHTKHPHISHHHKPEHHLWRTVLLIGASFIMLIGAVVVIYISTITLPDLSAFEERKIARSTKYTTALATYSSMIFTKTFVAP